MSGPPVIGLLGGIGSGKSTVARVFKDLGCVVADADADAHQVLSETEVVEALRERWGDGVVRPDGTPDRREIGRIVFDDPAERAWLESVVHPRVSMLRKERFEAAPEDATALLVDAPLILEANLDEECDHLVFIECPIEVRLSRVDSTRGWDAEELARREAAQVSLEEKRSRADELIMNTGSLAELEEQVRSILSRVRGGSGGRA